MMPGLGRSPGEGNDNPLQYSCLGNPMDRGAWRAIVHGVAKSQTRLNNEQKKLKNSAPQTLPSSEHEDRGVQAQESAFYLRVPGTGSQGPVPCITVWEPLALQKFTNSELGI